MRGAGPKRARANWRHLALIVLYVLGCVAGAYRFFSTDYQRRLVAELRLIALAISPDDLERLSGLPEDEGTSEYARVYLALTSVLKLDPRYKYAYIFALRDGDEVALVSTPAAKGTPAIRPGTVIGRTEAGEDRFFAGGSASIDFRAYRDPWGHWVSVAVPALLDEGTGRVRAALGLDIAYAEWRRSVLSSTAVATLIAYACVALAMLVVDRTRRWRLSLERLAGEERRKKDSAEESERAEREFLALMSHEIRNPLSAVVGFSRLLAETRLDGEQESHVEMLRASSEHLLALVNDILDFSKIEAGEMRIEAEAFDPGRLAREVLAIFSLQALRKGIDLRAEPGDPPCPAFVLGDELRVRQIAVNLVSNAVKFTERGTVLLRLSYPGAEGARRLAIRVEDTGPGMDAETMARLFMPFKQGKTGARIGGTGLGLAISKRLVGLMGGDISVESDLGKGSAFTVSLPLPPCDAPAAALEELEAPLAGIRILAADDDPANRALVARLLARRGAVVATASDGKEALAALIAAAPQAGYGAAVLDRSMPGMDGPQVARELREAERAAGLPRLRLVALTASVSVEEARDCLEAGFDAVLPKPFDPDRLAAALMPEGLEGGATRHAAPSALRPDSAEPAPRAEALSAERADGEGLVDEAALLGRAEGDAELVREIRAAFLETMRDSIEAARAALSAGDLPAARAAAHRLRGSALNACAGRAALAAAELEEAAASGAAERSRAALEALAALAGTLG